MELQSFITSLPSKVHCTHAPRHAPMQSRRDASELLRAKRRSQRGEARETTEGEKGKSREVLKWGLLTAASAAVELQIINRPAFFGWIFVLVHLSFFSSSKKKEEERSGFYCCTLNWCNKLKWNKRTSVSLQLTYCTVNRSAATKNRPIDELSKVQSKRTGLMLHQDRPCNENDCTAGRYPTFAHTSNERRLSFTDQRR